MDSCVLSWRRFFEARELRPARRATWGPMLPCCISEERASWTTQKANSSGVSGLVHRTMAHTLGSQTKKRRDSDCTPRLQLHVTFSVKGSDWIPFFIASRVRRGLGAARRERRRSTRWSACWKRVGMSGAQRRVTGSAGSPSHATGQGRRPSRPSTAAGARTGPNARTPPRPCSESREPAPPR